MWPKANRFSLFRRVTKELRPYWRELFALTVVGVVGAPLALLLPVPLKLAIDSIIGSDPLPAIVGAFFPNPDPIELTLYVAGCLSLVAIAILIRNNLEYFLRETITEKILLTFRKRLFAHALQLSTLFHERAGSQDAAYRIAYDAPALLWLTVNGFIPLLISFAYLCGIVAITARLSPLMSLLALGTTIPLVFFVHANERSLRDRWHTVKEIESLSHSSVREALSALRVVVTCGQELREVRRFELLSSSAFRAKRSVLFVQQGFDCLLGFTVALGTGAILYVGVNQVKNGGMTAGDLILVMTYLPQLYGPVQHFGNQLAGQQAAAASAERAFDLITRAPEITDRPGALRLDRAQGNIEFRNVGFAYSPGVSVFEGFSLLVPAGARVGIVGPTGAGKTTLANLLVRLIDPTTGAVMLDGHDLRDYALRDLRRQIAVLGQEALLFSGSVADNISYACPTASRAEIIAAAKKASADEFIGRLPESYDTLVGERGMRLSGGERQRIALARAILKDAAVLICDEPTSALDAQTEDAVLKSLAEFTERRTTFLISHRESAVQESDILLEVAGAIKIKSVRTSMIKHLGPRQILRMHTNGNDAAAS